MLTVQYRETPAWALPAARLCCLPVPAVRPVSLSSEVVQDLNAGSRWEPHRERQ